MNPAKESIFDRFKRILPGTPGVNELLLEIIERIERIEKDRA